MSANLDGSKKGGFFSRLFGGEDKDRLLEEAVVPGETQELLWKPRARERPQAGA